MNGDSRINQIATERSQSRQCPILVGTGKPAISDHISSQDRREFPGLGHDVPSGITEISTNPSLLPSTVSGCVCPQQ